MMAKSKARDSRPKSSPSSIPARSPPGAAWVPAAGAGRVRLALSLSCPGLGLYFGDLLWGQFISGDPRYDGSLAVERAFGHVLSRPEVSLEEHLLETTLEKVAIGAAVNAAHGSSFRSESTLARRQRSQIFTTAGSRPVDDIRRGQSVAGIPAGCAGRVRWQRPGRVRWQGALAGSRQGAMWGCAGVRWRGAGGRRCGSQDVGGRPGGRPGAARPGRGRCSLAFTCGCPGGQVAVIRPRTTGIPGRLSVPVRLTD
jgi:hypothetical protein